MPKTLPADYSKNYRAKKEILIKTIAPTIHALIEQAEIKRVKTELDKIDDWQALRTIETQLKRVDVDVDKIMVID